MLHETENVPAKTGEYPSDIPQFSKPLVLRKISEGSNRHNSRHYLFLKAHSFLMYRDWLTYSSYSPVDYCIWRNLSTSSLSRAPVHNDERIKKELFIS